MKSTLWQTKYRGKLTLNPERDCIANAHLEDKLIPPLAA